MADLPVHPPSWIDGAPVRNVAERRIAAPPAAVWTHVADHERWPEWFTALSTVRATADSSSVGGGRSVSMPGVTVDEEVTVWEPERQFAFAVVGAPRGLAGMAESVELRPDGDGCVVTYRQGIAPARGWGLVWRVLVRRMRHQLDDALDRLAERSERTQPDG